LTLQDLPTGRQTPLVAHIVIVFRKVEYELVTVLVDGVVSEVHAHVGQVLVVGSDVRLGGQSAEPLFVYEDPEWVTTCY